MRLRLLKISVVKVMYVYCAKPMHRLHDNYKVSIEAIETCYNTNNLYLFRFNIHSDKYFNHLHNLFNVTGVNCYKILKSLKKRTKTSILGYSDTVIMRF